ncbi:hypothetical protein [Streptomyces albiflavescens]|uniref:hypothetical protein n=1 Tax=Streptomyces albiflavescens TaxID=1623582 RepID=UPI00166E4232|nr:hypothetical protein [Streptomyces albiflavescens]
MQQPARQALHLLRHTVRRRDGQRPVGEGERGAHDDQRRNIAAYDQSAPDRQEQPVRDGSEHETAEGH